jgi:hypothetical protein
VAIAQDASTPAFSGTTGGTNLGTLTVTAGPLAKASASFSPPAGALVAVLAIAAYKSQQVFAATGMTCADSAANTYTAAVTQPCTASGNAASVTVFTRYYAAAPGSVTVTVTLAGAQCNNVDGQAIDLYPVVLTGCAASQAGAGTGTASITASATEQVSLTTTAAGSWAFVSSGMGRGSTYVANGVTTLIGSGSDAAGNSYGFGKMTTPTGTPGAVTLGWTDVYTNGTLAALEILPVSSTDATVTMGSALAVTAALPVPQPGSLSGPAYASSAADLGGGTGSWTSPGNADGAPDGSYATWAVV